MRDGADHLMTVEYGIKCMTTCPIRAVKLYIAIGTALGWNMTTISRGSLDGRTREHPLGGRLPY